MNKDLIQVDDKFYMKSKVVMLPAKEQTDISTHGKALEYDKNRTGRQSWKFQHLYFLSDDEIKEGDYYIDTMSDGYKVEHFKSKKDWMLVGICNSKKIIATTDPELTRSSITESSARHQQLPRPSDAFLKVYCEQGGIDEVLIEHKKKMEWYDGTGITHIKVAPDNTITIKELKPVQETWTRDQVISLLNHQKEFIASNFFGEPRIQIRKYGSQFTKENL